MLSINSFYWCAVIFAWQFCTGIGIPPLPEEATILWAGAMANLKAEDGCLWWLAWPTCVVAIILADLVLYSAGRYWGDRLFQYSWIKRFVPDERRLKLEQGFRMHGVKLLITARLLPLPGIRTAVFLTAGTIRYPFFRFFMADIFYAIPGVGFFFFCSYFSAEGLLRLYHIMDATLFWILVPAVFIGAGYLLYRYLKNFAPAGVGASRPPGAAFRPGAASRRAQPPADPSGTQRPDARRRRARRTDNERNARQRSQSSNPVTSTRSMERLVEFPGSAIPLFEFDYNTRHARRACRTRSFVGNRTYRSILHFSGNQRLDAAKGRGRHAGLRRRPQARHARRRLRRGRGQAPAPWRSHGRRCQPKSSPFNSTTTMAGTTA